MQGRLNNYAARLQGYTYYVNYINCLVRVHYPRNIRQWAADSIMLLVLRYRYGQA